MARQGPPSAAPLESILGHDGATQVGERGSYTRATGPIAGQGGRRADFTIATAPRCFRETGHCLGGRFLTHWALRGRLAINGYPLGGVFTQTLEDGRECIVQYFERVRFKHHPENAPPCDVLPGQLGRRILAEAGR